jgi:hypothetical protein
VLVHGLPETARVWDGLRKVLDRESVAVSLQTAHLDELEHCWMAEAPEAVAEVLRRFWAG